MALGKRKKNVPSSFLTPSHLTLFIFKNFPSFLGYSGDDDYQLRFGSIMIVNLLSRRHINSRLPSSETMYDEWGLETRLRIELTGRYVYSFFLLLLII